MGAVHSAPMDLEKRIRSRMNTFSMRPGEGKLNDRYAMTAIARAIYTNVKMGFGRLWR